MKKILDFPSLRQVYDYDCGANAIQGVLDYYGLDVREGVIMKIAKTNKKGTTINGLKRVAKYFKIKYKEGKMTTEDLKKWIDKKIPVIIILQAWTKKKNINWEEDWSDGHYVVVIGYSKNRIYFEDPSCERRTFISHKEFEKRWHDKDSKSRKITNWGMAIYRPSKSKKIYKIFLQDFWKKKFKPGFYYNKPQHMD
jgi:ABC-type bacteriocin/lantibiotic exporter with double-glycine peptidase domain